MLLLAVLAVIFNALPAGAESKAVLEYSTAELSVDASSIAASAPFDAKVHIQLQPGWHTYGENPGDAGIPTAMEWTLPEGFTNGPIRFPAAKTFNESGLTTYGYDEEVTLPVSITPPASISAGSAYTLAVKVDYLICKDICIPQTAQLSLTLTGSDAPTSSAAPPAGDAMPVTFPLALLLALGGGLILNLMPCVLPVLSLKALKLAHYHGKARAHVRLEGVMYTLGILLCFSLLAGVLIVLKQTGEQIGWGYHMQSAAFVGMLALLLFAIGLNLSGVYELPVLLGNVEVGQKHTLKKSFFTGVLATLVATPCTAPFMASAVGYGLTLPPLAGLSIFLALGFGLALPLLAISFFPALVSFLPKPGVWMEHFRQLLAFPMYASAIWLLWVLASQVGANGVAVILLAMLMLGFALWLRRLFAPQSRAYHLLAALLILLTLGLSAKMLHVLDARQPDASAASPLSSHGIAYSAEALARLRVEGTPVFIDATATWCITCQVNYRTSLSNAHVQQAFAQKNITFMVADWTRQNPEITALLASFGHSGVPLYVYYPAHGEPKVLPQLLTPEIVLEAIE